MTALKENYSETLARLKTQVLSSRFMRWWLGELTSMVPGWLRAPGVGAEAFSVVRLADIQTTASVLNEQGRQLALVLPKERVLRRTLSFPLAAEENLRQVIEFQVEQITPFPAGRVYFGYEVLARDFEQGQIKVEVVATPCDAVDVAIKAMEVQGRHVSAVFADELWSCGRLVNLFPGRLASQPSPLLQGANPWLLLLVVTLFLASLALPLMIKREAVVQLLPWVEKGKKAAEAVDTLRRELDGRIGQHNFVLEKRQAAPTVIQVLEELTRVLPDDTWVQSIDLKGKELQIQGETASSVRLIGLFEQSSLFKEASFKSPLTKGQVAGAERYQLSLQVRPAPLAATTDAIDQPSSAAQPASAAAPAATAGGIKP